MLGSKHSKANASFDWKGSFPNFSNADMLIVNLQSLDEQRLSDEQFQQSLYHEAGKGIFDMLMTGNKDVIVIMSSRPTDLKWLPMYPVYRPTASAKIGSMPDHQLMRSYLKNVETCPYYFHDLNIEFFNRMTNPKSNVAERYYFTPRAIYGHSVKWSVENEIKNVANQTIGGVFRVTIYYGYISTGLLSYKYEGIHTSGSTLFLPTPTKLDVEEAIDSLLDSVTGAVQKEPIPPEWDNSIDIPKLSTHQSELQGIEKQIQALNKQAVGINETIKELTRLRRLLWADSEPLESAVKDAFMILGFPEIRKMRAENLEDWVIDFKYVNDFEHAVLEVKASEKRTSMADLTQCNKWVEDYLLENKKVKGVFVPNQYRLNDVIKTDKKREQFAPNELDYARTREICILPTTQLFRAIVKKMTTDEEPSRVAIEEKLAKSNGLCALI